MRQVEDLVGYCALYEFEDVVAEVTGAEVFAPSDFRKIDFSRKVYKLLRHATGSSRLAASLSVSPQAMHPERSYDLFFPVFNNPFELFALNALSGWRKRSRFAACYICEALSPQMSVYLVEMLKDFDHIFIGINNSRDLIAEISGRPCSYLPMGVDALRFCPYPDPVVRSIDVCGIGRRSEVTHAALLAMSQRADFFYYYDTILFRPVAHSGPKLTFRVKNHREHRMLYANLLKRSRYFIANRAWADSPEERGNDEISARFYEGAAAGAIMLGETPSTEEFRSQFGWADSVISMPFDAPRVADVIAELDADPARSARIRKDGIVNALLHHDWVYRFRKVLEAVGLEAPEGLLAREARLRELAEVVAKA